MNIVINTKFKNNATGDCLSDMGKKLSLSGHNVHYDDWDNYQNYDVVLFISHDSDVMSVKKVNPNILVGILSAKLVTPKHKKEVKIADFLLVDSIEVRDLALKYNKNLFIYHIFPDLESIKKNHLEKEKITISYHGNKTHLTNADTLTEALDDLSLKYNIEFWSIYNIERYGKWNKNLPKKCPTKHIQWSENCFEEHLSKTDIGVCPSKTYINEKVWRFLSKPFSDFSFRSTHWLPYYVDTDYLIRFKYATNPGRIYPFSQLGIPVVADFVPSNCQVIQDGKSGFLVWSREGWYNALEKLIQSAELRNSMSQNLKNYIDNNCSPNINFKNFLEFLEELKIKKNGRK